MRTLTAQFGPFDTAHVPARDRNGEMQQGSRRPGWGSTLNYKNRGNELNEVSENKSDRNFGRVQIRRVGRAHEHQLAPERSKAAHFAQDEAKTQEARLESDKKLARRASGLPDFGGGSKALRTRASAPQAFSPAPSP